MKRRQLTLGIIKPDILVPSLPLLLQQRPSLTLQSLYANPPHILLSSSSSTAHNGVTTSQTPLEEILRMCERNGFEIVRSKLMDMSIEEAERFYGEHEGKFFYQRLVAFMTRCHPSQSSIYPVEMLKNRDLLQIGQWSDYSNDFGAGGRDCTVARPHGTHPHTTVPRLTLLIFISDIFNSIYLI